MVETSTLTRDEIDAMIGKSQFSADDAHPRS